VFKIMRWNSDHVGLAGLLIAAIGVWGGWIFHQSVALTQNAFYLAEWSTYLLDVRYGGLRPAPEILRLGIALSALAGAIGLAAIPNWRIRWSIRLIFIPIGLNLLPPYPDVFSLWWSPSYGGRFIVACIFWLGLAACLWLDRRSAGARRWGMIACAAGAMISVVWAYSQLIQPFQAHYAATLIPGWGLAAFLAGNALAIGVHLKARFCASPHRIKKGPVA